MSKRHEVELWCDFSREDLEAKARDLVSTIGQIDEVQTEKSNVVSVFKERLDGLHGNVQELAKQIREKGCTKSVECETTFHEPAVGMKRTVRIDTGGTVKVEEMTPEERQENLFSTKTEMDELDRLISLPDPADNKPADEQGS